MPMFVDTSPPGQCIFCRLVAGEIPAATVYEDALTIAFMDIGQVNPGHVLVATKRHAATLLDVTPEEAGAVMQTAQRVARAVQAVFDPPGLTLLRKRPANPSTRDEPLQAPSCPRKPSWTPCLKKLPIRTTLACASAASTARNSRLN